VKVVAVGDQKENENKRRPWTTAMAEADMLASLQHPYIVRYWDSFCEQGILAIVMDYSSGGNLAEKIESLRKAGHSPPEITVTRWFTQAVLALKYVHSKRIVHCDVKSQNMLLGRDGCTLRVADFGVARNLGTDDAICEGTTVGTPIYLSPEVLTSCRYSFASDVWALGIVLYEMTALRVPFHADAIRSLAKKIVKGPMPPLPNTYSEDLRRLSAEMNEFHFDQRPTFADIVQHPLVQVDIRRLIGEEHSKSAAGSGERDGSKSRSPPPLESCKVTNTDFELTALPSNLSVAEDLSSTSAAGATTSLASVRLPSPPPPRHCGTPGQPSTRTSRSPSPMAEPMEARSSLAACPRRVAPLERSSNNLLGVPSVSSRNRRLQGGAQESHSHLALGPPGVPTLDLGNKAAVPVSVTSRHSHRDRRSDRESWTCTRKPAPSSSRSFSARLRNAISIPRLWVTPPSSEQEGPAASADRSAAAALGMVRSQSAAAVSSASRGDHGRRALRPSHLPPLGNGLLARNRSKEPIGSNSSRDAEVETQAPSATEAQVAAQGVAWQGIGNLRVSQGAEPIGDSGLISTRGRRRPPCPGVMHHRNLSKDTVHDRPSAMREVLFKSQRR